MSMKTKIKAFFGASRQYVVSGALNAPSKFGYKIFLWYTAHELPVIPVNPREVKVQGESAVKSVTEVVRAAVEKGAVDKYDLSLRDGVSISFLTPPHITAITLKELATVKGFRDVVRGLWFQPGSYDEEVLDVANKIGLFDRVVYEDECILVRGEEGLYAANL